jgi:O-antigen/teichoic acid export membrane protein
MARTSVRLLVTTADQLASSLGNFVLVFSLARAASPEQFGTYALGVAVLNLALALSRSVVATPFTIDSSGDGEVSVARSSWLALATGSALALAAAPFVVAAAVLDPALAWVLLVWALALPLLTCQDFLRYVAVARGRPGVALVADGAWTLVVLVLFAYQVVAPSAAPAWVCAAVWAGGLLVATAVLIGAGLAERPRGAGAWAWLVGDRRHAQLAGDAALAGGGPIVLLSLVTLLCGADAVAALRGASTVFGPLNTLMAASILALVPEVRRRRDATGERLLVAATATLCTVAAGFGLVMALLVSDDIGSALLGETWPLTDRVLLATTVEYVGIALMTAGVVWCRAKNRVGVALRFQVANWVGLLAVTVVVGATVGTARGVAVGLAVVGLTMGAACLVRARRLSYS